jgi:type 1 glutamine amidotransferase
MTVSNVILSGGIFHPFDATSEHLAELFEPLGIRSTIYTDIEEGLAALRDERSELLTVNALRWRMILDKYNPYREEWEFELSAPAQHAILEHVERGGGLLGVHTASICFDGWPDWGDVLGAAWVWGESYHPPLGKVSVLPTHHAHPITTGLSTFEVLDEVYTRLDLRPDVEGLLTAEPGDGTQAQPLLWARTCGRGRVVYDALGHDVASMSEPTHRRILARAALWALGRDDAEVEAY